MTIKETDILKNTVAQNQVDWRGVNKFDYDSTAHTLYGEVRTGIDVFFVRVYVGGGTAQVASYDSFLYRREGAATFLQDSAVYSMQVQGEESRTFHDPFAVGGVSIGGFSLHGVCSTRVNSITGHRACSASLMFSAEF